MPVDAVEGLELWSGSVVVQLGQRKAEASCRVFMNMNWTNSLEIVMRDCSFHLFEMDRGCILHFPNASEPIEVYSIGGRWSGNPDDSFIRLAPRRSRIRITRESQIQKLTVALINLNPILLKNCRHWTLLGDGWAINVQPVPDEVDYPPLVQSGRYSITHHAIIYREDGSLDSVEAFTYFLDLFYLFLSFCSGYWISGTFVLGLDKEGLSVLEEWGTGRVSPSGLGDGWLDMYHAEEMINYFLLFVQESKSPDFRAMLDHVVYWNTRANTNLVGPDGSLILLQAILERLSWYMLVQSKRMLSEKGFNEMTAADQLRLLLGTCGIPIEVPVDLPELSAFAKSLGADGPEVLPRIRNRLVHPPKLNAAARGNSNVPYYQAYTLAKWYVELSVLKITGFKGKYSNRVSQDRWEGKVESVPWAK